MCYATLHTAWITMNAGKETVFSSIFTGHPDKWRLHNKFLSTIEEYCSKRGLSHQIMKIELVSISATESLFLHSEKVS